MNRIDSLVQRQVETARYRDLRGRPKSALDGAARTSELRGKSGDTRIVGQAFNDESAARRSVQTRNRRRFGQRPVVVLGLFYAAAVLNPVRSSWLE